MFPKLKTKDPQPTLIVITGDLMCLGQYCSELVSVAIATDSIQYLSPFLHCVVDGEARNDRPTSTIDVQVNRLVAVLCAR